MDGDTTARVIYLGILLAALSGALFSGLRYNTNRTLQNLAIWACLFVALIAGYSLWPTIDRALHPDRAQDGGGALEFQAAADGQFYVQAIVNGALVRFVIDTGASGLVLNEKDARAAGFEYEDLTFDQRAQTANGEVQSAAVQLKTMVLGPYEDFDLPADVNGGSLDTSLMGMSYLQKYDLLFVGDTLRLLR